MLNRLRALYKKHKEMPAFLALLSVLLLLFLPRHYTRAPQVAVPPRVILPAEVAPREPVARPANEVARVVVDTHNSVAQAQRDVDALGQVIIEQKVVINQLTAELDEVNQVDLEAAFARVKQSYAAVVAQLNSRSSRF